jgi:hypothetical protein
VNYFQRGDSLHRDDSSACNSFDTDMQNKLSLGEEVQLAHQSQLLENNIANVLKDLPTIYAELLAIITGNIDIESLNQEAETQQHTQKIDAVISDPILLYDEANKKCLSYSPMQCLWTTGSIQDIPNLLGLSIAYDSKHSATNSTLESNLKSTPKTGFILAKQYLDFPQSNQKQAVQETLNVLLEKPVHLLKLVKSIFKGLFLKKTFGSLALTEEEKSITSCLLNTMKELSPSKNNDANAKLVFQAFRKYIAENLGEQDQYKAISLTMLGSIIATMKPLTPHTPAEEYQSLLKELYSKKTFHDSLCLHELLSALKEKPSDNVEYGASLFIDLMSRIRHYDQPLFWDDHETALKKENDLEEPLQDFSNILAVLHESESYMMNKYRRDLSELLLTEIRKENINIKHIHDILTALKIVAPSLQHSPSPIKNVHLQNIVQLVLNPNVFSVSQTCSQQEKIAIYTISVEMLDTLETTLGLEQNNHSIATTVTWYQIVWAQIVHGFSCVCYPKQIQTACQAQVALLQRIYLINNTDKKANYSRISSDSPSPQEHDNLLRQCITNPRYFYKLRELLAQQDPPPVKSSILAYAIYTYYLNVWAEAPPVQISDSKRAKNLLWQTYWMQMSQWWKSCWSSPSTSSDHPNPRSYSNPNSSSTLNPLHDAPPCAQTGNRGKAEAMRPLPPRPQTI